MLTINLYTTHKNETALPGSVRTLVVAAIAGRDKIERFWPFSPSKFYTSWDEIRKIAGCPEIHFHDLRRTSARAKRSSGVNTSVIMDIQGWRSEAMFRRYGIVDIQDKAQAFEQLAEYERLQNDYTPPKNLQN